MLSQVNEFAKNYEYFINAVGAFLPFLISCLMVVIAFQQWKTNERKRRQDLFDKRFKFYCEMKNIFEAIYEGDEEALNLDSTHDDNRADLALFLFGKDIQEHIINLFDKKIKTHDDFTQPFKKYLSIEQERTNNAI